MAAKAAGTGPRSVTGSEPVREAGTSQTLKAQLGLRELILDGELAPGERISELWLVERLGVSRTPVRAALLRLLDEGFLDPIPSGGFAVRAFSESDVRDAIELRGTLEGMAARLAAERGVPARMLHAMYAVVEEIDAVLAEPMSEQNFARYIQCNERFHALLARACGSSVLERQIGKAVRLPFASPSSFVMVQAGAPDARDVLILAQAQHRAVLDAIERREGARAEALMREHARIALRNLQSAFESHAAMGRLQGGALIRRAAV